MKKVTLFMMSLALLFLGSTAFTVIKNTETVTVDPEKSTVKWQAYKVTGEHMGTVDLESGKLEFEDGKLTGGTFTIDMTSINVTDLEGKYKAKLEGHLKSPDFFGVENHPTATFTITDAVYRGVEGEYKIVGDFTIKDKTHESWFIAKLDDEKKMATAKIKLDRAKYDVRYGSGSFFDNLGDKTIYDEFDLEVALAY